MLKRAFFISMMAVVMAFAVAQMGMAGYTISTVGGLGPYTSAGGGGEFSVRPAGGLEFVWDYYAAVTRDQNGSNPKNFQTFCLENDEYLSGGNVYDAALNTAAVAGGSGGPSPDPVSKGTADLFWRFATNNWAGTGVSYAYGGTVAQRQADAGLLQDAIWYLEQEISSISNNKYYTYVSGIYGATVGDPNAGLFPVAALNLSQLDASGKQILNQDVLTVVPIPPAVFLLGSGFLGLVGIRRWRKK
jgi:hypothetical protein